MREKLKCRLLGRCTMVFIDPIVCPLLECIHNTACLVCGMIGPVIGMAPEPCNHTRIKR